LINTVEWILNFNSYDSFRLGILYSSYSNFDFRIFEDKHIKVFRPVTQLDFSAHTLYDTAIKWAVENKSAKENQFEAFSRDFTVNSITLDATPLIF
jgi:hypothetical protein